MPGQSAPFAHSMSNMLWDVTVLAWVRHGKQKLMVYFPIGTIIPSGFSAVGMNAPIKMVRGLGWRKRIANLLLKTLSDPLHDLSFPFWRRAYLCWRAKVASMQNFLACLPQCLAQ